MHKLRMTCTVVHSDGTADHGWADMTTGDWVSVEEAGPEAPPWAEVDVEPDADDDDRTAVDIAVEALLDAGAVEPSCFPSWSPKTWYSSVDPVTDRDGDEVYYSAHLVGFSEEEEQEVYRRVIERHWRC